MSRRRKGVERGARRESIVSNKRHATVATLFPQKAKQSDVNGACARANSGSSREPAWPGASSESTQRELASSHPNLAPQSSALAPRLAASSTVNWTGSVRVLQKPTRAPRLPGPPGGSNKPRPFKAYELESRSGMVFAWGEKMSASAGFGSARALPRGGESQSILSSVCSPAVEQTRL